MKRVLFSILSALLFAGPSFAATVDDLVGLGMKPELAEYVAGLSTVLSNAEWITATDQAGTGTINMVKVDATDDLVVNADSGDLIKVSVATTPVAAVGAATPVAAFTPGAVANWVLNGSITTVGAGLVVGAGASFAGDVVMAAGKQVQQAVAIITPSTDMTPAAASNLASPINRLVAGSPTLAAVHLPAATPNKGKTYFVNNEGSNPVLVFPNGEEKINAGGAGTPVSVAAGKLERCIITQNDTSLCVLEN